jgi:hypothetical protein
VLEGGGKSLADLIASVDRGLLVTRFWYIRVVNPQTMQMTGLTRDGVFLIEQGKVTSPVMNFRFNQSPVEMLKNTVAMGKPVRVRGGEGQGMIAPPIVVKDFSFTSISDAVYRRFATDRRGRPLCLGRRSAAHPFLHNGGRAGIRPHRLHRPRFPRVHLVLHA